MKLVINRCYGGFGVSTEALKLLIARGSKAVEVSEPENYYGRRGLSGYEEDVAKSRDAGDGYRCNPFVGTLYRDGKIYNYRSDHDTRNDPVLISVVEELGEKANGEFADLSIVEVPDDVSWEIDEYDGIESVHEVHRVWS